MNATILRNNNNKKSILRHINCILDKSIVIHENPDDEGLLGLKALIENRQLNKEEKESLKTGNAGIRIACGNITKYNCNY